MGAESMEEKNIGDISIIQVTNDVYHLTYKCNPLMTIVVQKNEKLRIAIYEGEIVDAVLVRW